MATMNPFDLLGGDDNEDPSQLIAAKQIIEPKKPSAQAAKTTGKPAAAAQAKLPGKPLPPAQAVREAKSESARGGRGGGGDRSYSRDRGGPFKDSSNYESSYRNRERSTTQGSPDDINGRNTSERRGGYGAPRGSSSGGRRGDFNNGEAGEGEHDRARRYSDRRSGTGRGYEMKREGAGRGNWGTEADELAPVAPEVVEEAKKPIKGEKPSVEDGAAAEGAGKTEVEEKESENKEMTLEEYEKLLEEKRKALAAVKVEERKVDTKVFESMKPLANKKGNDGVFIKLGSEKDRRKESAEKEERAKKSVSINEFLKPAEGEQFFNRRGGRGRGRGGGGGGSISYAPAIEDPGEFPSLGGGK